MNQKQVVSTIRALADAPLNNHGFLPVGSGATYCRRVSEPVSVFIVFDFLRRKPVFDVKVFPSTPRFGDWDSHFPVAVGIPTGNKCGLNAALEVGHGASMFSCATAQALRAAMLGAVLPAVERHAIPYLAQFIDPVDIVPFLEHPQWTSLLVEP